MIRSKGVRPDSVLGREWGVGPRRKGGAGNRGSNKLIEATSDRPRLAVIIEDGGGDKFPKLGGREVFVGGGGRSNK